MGSGKMICCYPMDADEAAEMCDGWADTHSIALFVESGSGIPRHPRAVFFRVRERVGDYKAAAEAAVKVAYPHMREVQHDPAPEKVDTSIRRVEKFNTLAGGELGFVAVYFNPCGYQALRRNFIAFLERFAWMGDRLLVVELAFGERAFELTGRAENILQLRGEDVLWQKEALINVGSQILRDRGFENVGWLDGDVELLGDLVGEDWFAACVAEMGKNGLVQVVESVEHKFSDVKSNLELVSVARFFVRDKQPNNIYLTGVGWIMDGEIWDECGWYDRDVVGAGDRLLFLAAVGRSDLCASSPAGLWEDYQRWADKLVSWVGDGVGYVSGSFCVCEAHGSHANRSYNKRECYLVRSGFDPAVMVRRDVNGVLMWTAAAPQLLKQGLIDYFNNRREDSR